MDSKGEGGAALSASREIKILGAGLSGLTAAINLARSGYGVSVYEQEADCGKRFHGDLEGIENWSSQSDVLEDLTSMNIKVNFDCHPFFSLLLSNGYETLNFHFKRPLFYLVKRGDMEGSLDQGLKKQAIELGVKINFNSRAEGADIIATGTIPNEIAAVARGIIFDTDMDDVALALFNDDVVDGGYSYLLVAKGYGCIGTVLFDKFANANKCFQKARQVISQLVNLDIREEKDFSGVGSFSLRRRLDKEKSLYIGEAAGLQDLLWGFGIRYALTSGFLGAKSIADGDDYEALIRQRFDHMLRASVVNRFVWERIGWRRYSCLMSTIKRIKDPIDTLYKYTNFSTGQRLLFPLARFILGTRYRGLRL